MRRTIIHISLALLTFTIGFLSSGTYDDLTIALLVALAVLILLKKITSLNITLHHLIVTVLTLLIWIPFAALTLHVVMPPASCVINFSEEETKSVGGADKQKQTIVNTETGSDESPVASNYYSGTNDLTANAIWAGMVDKEAIRKPALRSPMEVKSLGIETMVAVAVIIDANGRVIAAQALSGHPLLHQSAIEAAYQARFPTVKIREAPPHMSGILTYYFKP